MDIGGEDLGNLHLGPDQNGIEESPDGVNISDVLEAISQADPSYGVVPALGDGVDMSRPPAMPQQPYVAIVEQPASKALRFRYICEGRSAGSIPGVNSTPENKTYPTIKICNYVGPVHIVASCVTKESPYRPHPHNLVGRDRCDKGVCTVKTKVTEDANEYQFKNLGIQCVKRRDIADALHIRSTLKVDPFRTGFDHKNNPQSIDLNAVRLAFQVFIPDEKGRLTQLRSVASDIIYDKKAMCDLQIMRSSHCSGAITGGTQVIVLCEKITREDTAVVFFEEENGVVVWEQHANIVLVHRLVAVVFETPPYRRPAHPCNVNVQFQLKRISDRACSNSLPFEYIAEFPDVKKRKTVMQSLVHTTYDQESHLKDLHFSLMQEPAIKLEPNTPPHRIYSPPAQPPQPQPQQQWGFDMGQMVGPSGAAMAPVYGQELWTQFPPSPQPQHQQMQSPHHQMQSPHHQMQSPHHQIQSPHHQLQSPHQQLQSPQHLHQQLQSPHQQFSPSPHHPSPLGPALSPALVHHQPLSPEMVQHQQHQQQQQQHQQLQQQQQQLPYQMDTVMETQASGPSLSTLLGGDGADGEGGPLAADLFSLSSMMDDRENLSDSLRLLSTNDLFMTRP